MSTNAARATLVTVQQPTETAQVFIGADESLSTPFRTHGRFGFSVWLPASWDTCDIAFRARAGDLIQPVHGADGERLIIENTQAAGMYIAPADVFYAMSAESLYLECVNPAGDVFTQDDAREIKIVYNQ